MADITIHKPLQLEFSVLDAEDTLPSFEVSITMIIPNFSGTLNYNANSVWFECSKWDSFAKDISLDTTNATLANMSESFKIELTKEQEKYSFSISCKMHTLSKGTFNFNTTYELNNDDRLQILESFEQFPKWW